LLGAALLAFPAHAEPAAEGSRDLHWRDEWPRFRPIEYVLTPIVGAASFAIFFFVDAPSEPHWNSGILFDDAVRGALQADSVDGLETWRAISDVTGVASMVWALGIDSIVVPLARGSSDVAFQMLLMDAESYAFGSLVTAVGLKTIGRARPSFDECVRDPNVDPLCGSGASSSFPSGHTNQAFTAAGLSCAHHLGLGLYGAKWADVTACAGTTALATTTAMARLFGDRHYATDVIVGAGLGFGFGYALPMLLHYTPSSSRSDAVHFTIAPFALGPGVAVLGRF
jgi:membrane-associated phospholipid phosphatase